MKKLKPNQIIFFKNYKEYENSSSFVDVHILENCKFTEIKTIDSQVTFSVEVKRGQIIKEVPFFGEINFTVPLLTLNYLEMLGSSYENSYVLMLDDRDNLVFGPCSIVHYAKCLTEISFGICFDSNTTTWIRKDTISMAQIRQLKEISYRLGVE